MSEFNFRPSDFELTATPLCLPSEIYELPKIFCKQTSVPVPLLAPTRVPLHIVQKQYMCNADRNPRLDFMSTSVGGPTALLMRGTIGVAGCHKETRRAAQ